MIHRDLRLTPGRCRTAPRLALDQLGDGVGSISQNTGWPSYRRCDHLVVDDEHADVLAGHHLLDEDVGTVSPGLRNRVPQGLRVPDPHRDPPTLLAAGGLDHDRPDPFEEIGVRGVVAGGHSARDPQAGIGQDTPGHPLVVTSGHGQRAGQLRQRLAGVDDLGALGEPQFAPLRVGHLDADAAAHRLVRHDLRVRVQLVVVLGGRGTEQPLVDRALALDHQFGHLPESQPLVEPDGAGVVAPSARRQDGRAAPVPDPPERRRDPPSGTTVRPRWPGR
jgi:hypothetical protein